MHHVVQVSLAHQLYYFSQIVRIFCCFKQLDALAGDVSRVSDGFDDVFA